ncbi:MAG: hypothetical protein AAF639_42625, partial [Chloroflexota bacterium]
MNGADDPPIVIGYLKGDWELSTTTFSEHVYSCVWDYGFAFPKPEGVGAQNSPLSKNALSALRELFTEGLTTYDWLWDVQYRFSGERMKVSTVT